MTDTPYLVHGVFWPAAEDSADSAPPVLGCRPRTAPSVKQRSTTGPGWASGSPRRGSPAWGTTACTGPAIGTTCCAGTSRRLSEGTSAGGAL